MKVSSKPFVGQKHILFKSPFSKGGIRGIKGGGFLLVNPDNADIAQKFI